MVLLFVVNYGKELGALTENSELYRIDNHKGHLVNHLVYYVLSLAEAMELHRLPVPLRLCGSTPQ